MRKEGWVEGEGEREEESKKQTAPYHNKGGFLFLSYLNSLSNCVKVFPNVSNRPTVVHHS